MPAITPTEIKWIEEEMLVPGTGQIFRAMIGGFFCAND